MPTPADHLAEARDAYHRLQTGTAVVTVADSNGERVEYRAASAPRLAAYIRDLENRIAGGDRPRVVHLNTSKGLI